MYCGHSCFPLIAVIKVLFFRFIYIKYNTIEAFNYAYSNSNNEDSNCIVKQLRHKDLYLSYFYKVQKTVGRLKSGDKLKVDESGCLDLEGNRVLCFSKKFKEELFNYNKKGYRPVGARVDYVLYWEEEDKGIEVPIVFPILEFEKPLQ